MATRCATAPDRSETPARPGVAGLPMYDLAELAGWQASWWRGLARHLRAAGVAGVPGELTTRSDPRYLWARRDLLFAQACGYPLTHAFAGCLQVLAIPHYSAPGCDAGRYTSAVVVRTDSRFAGLAELCDHTVAVNATDSFSGCHALHEAMAGVRPGARPPFRLMLRTGSHAASAAAVQAGRVDACAVDAVTWSLLAMYRPQAVSGLRVLARTAHAPGLPFVTRAGRDAATVAALRKGLFAALTDPALESARAALLLAGAEVPADDTYAEIPRRVAATRRRCPELAAA